MSIDLDYKILLLLELIKRSMQYRDPTISSDLIGHAVATLLWVQDAKSDHLLLSKILSSKCVLLLCFHYCVKKNDGFNKPSIKIGKFG